MLAFNCVWQNIPPEKSWILDIYSVVTRLVIVLIFIHLATFSIEFALYIHQGSFLRYAFYAFNLTHFLFCLPCICIEALLYPTYTFPWSWPKFDLLFICIKAPFCSLSAFTPHSHQKLSCFKCSVSYSSTVSLPMNQGWSIYLICHVFASNVFSTLYLHFLASLSIVCCLYMHQSSFLSLICPWLATISIEFAFYMHYSSLLPLIFLWLTKFSI